MLLVSAKCTRRNPPANCVASSEDDDENEGYFNVKSIQKLFFFL